MAMPDIEDQKPQQQQEADTADPSVDNPSKETSTEAAAAAGLSPDQQSALLEVRKRYKESWAPKRQLFLRRVLRAFEVLKNNPYVLYNEGSADYDTLTQILQGVAAKEDIDLYEYQDNVYQMLCLAFIATLAVDVSKTRYQPSDAMNEEDIITAKKASTIHAFNERQNGIDGKQQLELLFLWVSGQFFTYVRHIIDRNRAGVSKDPITATVNTVVMPNRYICPNCGGVTPEDQIPALRGKAVCPDCKGPMSDSDWHQEQSLPLPIKIGEKDTPNGMTAFDIFSGLNIDADPDAKELYESMILDLEVETNVAVVRAAYPAMYKELQAGETGDESSNGEYAKRARSMVTAPAGNGSSMLGVNQSTYSRCWMQPESFNILDDQAMADGLRAIFPDGVKLVTYAGEKFLQATPERMMDHWTWCPTLKGLGLYPFGAGDCALEIQSRINDAANTVHAYLDRIAFPSILFDADIIDGDAMVEKPNSPGSMTPVSRTDEDTGSSRPLSDLMFQPEFHIDSHIFQYEPQLIQLAQTLSGVQPQTFGGSDPNVQTMGGQAQALKTAVGRMMLFLKRIREEHADRARNSVRCSIDNMDDQMRIVIDGEAEGDYSTEVMLRNELTGDFICYPESDEGFPATYQEIQDRIVQLLTQGQKSPFIGAVLSDPDTQKVVARYILPDQITLPGDEERSRLKMLMQQLSKNAPNMAQGPNGPMAMPTILPNPAFDDMDMAVTISKKWLQQNWQLEKANPDGFNNVLAFLRVVSQMQAEQMAKQQLQLAAASGGGPGGPGGPPTGAGPGPQAGPPQGQSPSAPPGQ